MADSTMTGETPDCNGIQGQTRLRATSDAAKSIAWDALYALDNIESELVAVSSTATLLATAESLDESAQNAFISLAAAIDRTLDRVAKDSARFSLMRDNDRSTPAVSSEYPQATAGSEQSQSASDPLAGRGPTQFTRLDRMDTLFRYLRHLIGNVDEDLMLLSETVADVLFPVITTLPSILFLPVSR